MYRRESTGNVKVWCWKEMVVVIIRTLCKANSNSSICIYTLPKGVYVLGGN